MASFIYFYSKFTEEFLLLSAAGIFALSAMYCYHWVVKRRLLGAARNQVPAGVVKAYLNQLIGEAQFVRTQLFGLIAAGEKVPNLAQFQMFSHADGHSSTPTTEGDAHTGSAVPSDLLARLKALEAQLSEKESMVVNVNVEKTKLNEELENLKRNSKAVQVAASSAGAEDLTKKIKTLEERLEEYSLFEDDLANLKRLQQENAQLKKRLEENGGAQASVQAKTASPTPAEAPKVEAKKQASEETEAEGTPKVAAPEKTSLLDQSAIDALLQGETPVPVQETAPSPVSEDEVANLLNAGASPAREAENNEPAVAEAPAPKLKLAPEAPAPQVETSKPAPIAAAPTPTDDFEKLVDSVETSLDLKVAAKATTGEPAPENPKEDSLLSKTDEELLKEFENLLNS
jgi:predicted  nucleic acid-binding Zn-ribbon protein